MKTLFILLLSSFSLYSQVIIKERLEIQPKLKIPLQATSTPDQNTTWIDIYYDYPNSGWNYWPMYWGLTRLEVNGVVDTISLHARFNGYSTIRWKSPTIGPVSAGTTGEIKHYDGPEYNYGYPQPTYHIAAMTYIQKNPPIGNDIASYEVWGNYAGSYKLHGTLRYMPVPKPTVFISNIKHRKHHFSNSIPTIFPVFTFTCLTTPTGKYAPTITWAPQQTFDMKNYLNKVKPGDTLRIPVKVTATNIAGSASDTGSLTLTRYNDIHHITVFATPDSINQSDSSIITLKAYRWDNIDVTSTLPGNMRVSFSLSNSGGTLNSYNCSLDSAVNNQIKFRPNPMATGITKTKVFATLDGKYTDDTTVTIKGCPTPIPMCNNNNFPQRFDSSWFETYKEDDVFNWIDKNGVQKSTILSMCDYIPEGNYENLDGRFGVTFPLMIHPLFKSDLSETIKTTEVCLDGITNPNDPQWRFIFPHIRIPIIVTTCAKTGISQFRDMGSSKTEWDMNVTDKNIFYKVEEAMEWWVVGSYFNQTDEFTDNNFVPNGYIFSGMTMVHERAHLQKIKEDFEKNISTGLNEVYNLSIKKSEYPCLEDARTQKSKAEFELEMCLFPVLGGMSIEEWIKIEKEADDNSRPEKQEILDNFRTWAKTQPWYKP